MGVATRDDPRPAMPVRNSIVSQKYPSDQERSQGLHILVPSEQQNVEEVPVQEE